LQCWAEGAKERYGINQVGEMPIICSHPSSAILTG